MPFSPMASSANSLQRPDTYPSRPRPVSAAALASIELQRRDTVRRLGPCPSGCGDLDGYVLLGGLERGSVAGISAEEEDAVGVTLGLQILICSLLANAVHKVQIVTPKPPSTIVVLLKNGITAELKARGITDVEDVAAQRRDCLDRIMLSRVFDMDGFCEVLVDLESAAAASGDGGDGLRERGFDEVRQVEGMTVDQGRTGEGAGSGATGEGDEAEQPHVVAEIRDSQDEDEPLSPLPTPPQPDIQDKRGHQGPDHADETSKNDTSGVNNTAAADNHNPKPTATPDIILVTHFSSLLTNFFTQRDKPTAHAALRHLSSRLRRLSRTLPSHPLILLINSTDSGAAAHSSASHGYENPPPEQPPTYHNNSNNRRPPVDPTLRSIFNPTTSGPSSALQSPPVAHGQGQGFKPNKPTFGLVFTQLLDLHLLCTRAPRPSKTTAAASRALTVVEVLLDDIGLWEGERGTRTRREQRWTVVASSNGRIVDASDGERLKGLGGG